LKITDLGPRDDLESLAYTAFFLLTADLPWRTSGSHNESMKHNMQRIRASKAATSGDKLGAGFPAEFGYLLDYSRRLEYDQMPDYAELKRSFTNRVGGKDAEGPLDWSSVGISISEEHIGAEIAHSEDDMESDDENDEGDEEENLGNSYFNWDIADWDVQGARDRSLTLPMEQVELADSSIPQIIEVTE
jgi:casein kinase 1 delta